jgi:hypothetical protein
MVIMHKKFARRELLKSTLFGTSGLGLQALASGLPVAFLSRPLAARAQDAACEAASVQYLILSTSGQGDPLNANVPGTYDFPDNAHAPDPNMEPAPLLLGGRSQTAARVWSTLPQWVLDRTCFFHHATLTNNHANLPKVLRLMGQTARQEMLPSIFAKVLAPCFGTVQVDPISAGAGNLLTIEGRSLPNVPPTTLRDLLTRPNTPLMRLQPLRDRVLDQMHGLLKQRGTPSQRQYLDSLARSREQARAFGSDLVELLSDINNDGPAAQVAAAVALIKMNVAPVITIRIPFGGDNHSDNELRVSEVPQHLSGIAQIGALMESLRTAGLQDRVTFAACNVFGRTLKKLGLRGRDHWGSHNTAVLIGPRIRAGVVGGLEPKAMDYYATAIDSKTGAKGGDIEFGQTLPALGKTLGAALGIPSPVLDATITGGRVVTAAIA